MKQSEKSMLTLRGLLKNAGIGRKLKQGALRLVLGTMLAGCCLSTSGCAIAAVGLASGYMGNQDKSEFHRVNLEREKAGLRPLSREEWKHQMNPGEVRRTKGDVAGLHHGGDVRQGESRPAYSSAPAR